MVAPVCKWVCGHLKNEAPKNYIQKILRHTSELLTELAYKVNVFD